MSDPQRWIDPPRLIADGATSEESELLRSWQAVQPTESARAAVFSALAAGGAGAVAKGGAIAGKGTAAGALVAVKWLAGVAAVGALGGVSAYAHRVSRPQASAVAPLASPATAPLSVQGRTPDATPPPVIVAPSAPMPTPPGAPHAQPVEAHPRGTAHPRPSLGEQVSAVDAARRALAAGDASSALARVDQYEARFHGGVLVEEAEVLRVEALLAEGDRASATRVGERFLAAHPTSPHAARVRALLAPL